MALEKKLTTDYKVLGEFKHINIIEKTTIVEDGKELSFSIHNIALTPSDDISNQSDELKDLANAVWTDAVKKAWSDKQKAELPE
tara:strand:- start:41 stop:292 length:252 start_codon:yes stop_codon:yes gene_type:complete